MLGRETAILNKVVKEAVSFEKNLKKLKCLLICIKVRTTIPG